MKYPLLILITATAMLVLAIYRSFGNHTESASEDPDGSSPVPRITARLVEKFAFIGGTDTEIADRFMVEEQFLRRRFGGVLRRARAMGKLNIRGLQNDLAKKNPAMAMWLGRNVLGQSNNPGKPDDPMPEIYED
jgi:hypothetical protein